MGTKIDKFTLENATTVKATWKVKQYTYQLITNGGSVQTETGTNDHAFNDGNISLPIPTRNGYEFVGWYVSPNFKEPAVTKFVNENKTYYAKWAPKVYKISFNLGNVPGSEAYFKYGSLSFTYDNLPLTLGVPVAEGYEFNGWHTGASEGTQNAISEINTENISYFNSSNELALTAGWNAKRIGITEEIYRQSNNPDMTTYELVQVNQPLFEVGSAYSKSFISFPGFEEVEDNSELTISNGLIVKRYFTRKTHRVTLQIGDTYGAVDTEVYPYTLSEVDGNYGFNFNFCDNDIPLPLVNGKDRYTFLTWRDENNRPVDSIPAYCNSDRTYYACFSQKKPMEGVDFTLGYDLLGSYDGEEMELVRITPGLSMIGAVALKNSNFLNIDEYYTNVNSTQYAQLYFPEETNGDKTQVYVEPSEVVAVPIKFAKAAPAESVFTTTDTTTTPTVAGIELVEDNGVTQDVPQNTEITYPDGVDTLGFRYKETYMYNASAVTKVIKRGLLTQDAPVISNELITKSTYTTKGKVDVSNLNNNRNLQYKEGESNAWLDVSEGTTFVSLDDGISYFRYKHCTISGETYAASVATPVEIKKASVAVSINVAAETFPTKAGVTTNADSFEISVDAGTQLSACPEYIEWVNSATRFGYYQAIPRATKFLKNGETDYNEANIITGDGDVSLTAQWVPNKNTYKYLESAIINNGSSVDEFNVEPKSGTFSYGQNAQILWDATFAPSADSKQAYLNYLDRNAGMLPSFSNAIKYSEDGGASWNDLTIDGSVANDGTFTFTATTTPNTIDNELFCTLFKPVFSLESVSDTNVNDAVAEFTFAGTTDGNCTVTLTGNKASSYTKYKFDQVTKRMDFYTTDFDVDGTTVISTTSFNFDLGSRTNNHIDVMFHAGIDLCAKDVASVEVKKAVYNGTDYYVLSGDGDISANTDKGWSVKEQ